MNNKPHWLRAVVLALVAALIGVAATATTAKAAAPGSASLRLRWAVEKNVFPPEVPEVRSLAAFTLTNLGSAALEDHGWALYFNCIAEVVPGPLPGGLIMEHISGTLFRMRPTPGFAPLAGGQSRRIEFFHPDIMVKVAKAPLGPYLVFDAQPDKGWAITDYTLEPLTTPQQLDRGSVDPHPLITPQDVFQRNASIQTVPLSALSPVFPTPVQWERRSGSLHWSALPQVLGPKALQPEIEFARSMLKPYFGAAATPAAQPALRLVLGAVAGQTSPEAYELAVDAQNGVTVTGNSPAGVACGLQSLREALPLPQGASSGVTLDALMVRDAPRFEYRGFQLDVARNFQPKATVLRLLDLMVRYKLNKLHLHLTDDEGWRLEIRGLPELTTVGARRGHTLDSRQHLQAAYGSGPDVSDALGSGFYTRADYVDILRYAAARHIEVIPEIEMPGHARAAVKVMESRTLALKAAGHKDADRFLLSDPADASVYRSAQNYRDHVMNPGLSSTYAFVDHVVAEVVALHKEAGVGLRTLHVGADELPNGAWEKSPAALALMQKQHLASTVELWDYFYDHVDQSLRRHGLRAAGWEELGARKVKVRGASKLIPNPYFTHRDFTLYVWNNLDDAVDLAYRMANAGYKTVLAPATNLYFDMAYNKNPEEPGVNWAAYTDLIDVFDFIPLDYVRKSVTDAARVPGRDSLSDYGQRNVLGLEGTLFTETVRDRARMDFLIMPRLLALAERAWAADPAWTQENDAAKAASLHAAAWAQFVNQLGQSVLPKLDAEMPGVLYRIPPPGLQRVNNQVLVNHQWPGFELRYTADGSEPTASSPRVNGPISAKGSIAVAAFDRSGRSGRSARMDNP